MRRIPIDLIRDATYCVNYLLYTNEKGMREFLYIATRRDQMKSLQNAIRRGNFIAEDYGMILEHGQGEAPDYIKEKMTMLYKCNHEGSLSLLDFDADVV